MKYQFRLIGKMRFNACTISLVESMAQARGKLSDSWPDVMAQAELIASADCAFFHYDQPFTC
ncbi:MAG TPA: hypothetical protein VF669_03910 [Tepidisphaeraceae bacterium]|jgi:hypothetical protein